MEIHGFDTVEEMFDFINKNRQVADNFLHTEGNRWRVLVRPGDMILYTAGPDLPCLGIVEEIEDPDDREMLAANNSILITGYSPIVPEGEMGSIHLSAVQGWVTEKLFDVYKEACRDGDNQKLQASTAMLDENYIHHTLRIIADRMTRHQ